MMPSEVLDGAADLLERDGWQQGSVGGDGGPCCVGGALSVVVDAITPPLSKDANTALFLQAVEAFARRGVEAMITWNDAPGRTQVEVVAKLREVAASERKAGR